MILQHCPSKYKGKDYGCGYGPIAPTPAFLDHGGKCIRCGKEYRPWRKPKPVKAIKAQDATEQCQVSSAMDGTLYCPFKATHGKYCARHEHVNY